MSGLLLFLHDMGEETPIDISPDATIRDLAEKAGLSRRKCVLAFGGREFLPGSDELIADIGIGQEARIYIRDWEEWTWAENAVEGTESKVCRSLTDLYTMTRCANKLQKGRQICLRAEIVKTNLKLHDFGVITERFDLGKQNEWQTGFQSNLVYFTGHRIGKDGEAIELVLNDDTMTWYRCIADRRYELESCTFPTECFPLTPVIQTYDSNVEFKISAHRLDCERFGVTTIARHQSTGTPKGVVWRRY